MRGPTHVVSSNVGAELLRSFERRNVPFGHEHGLHNHAGCRTAHLSLYPSTICTTADVRKADLVENIGLATFEVADLRRATFLYRPRPLPYTISSNERAPTRILTSLHMHG
jgi:hypothetical protein